MRTSIRILSELPTWVRPFPYLQRTIEPAELMLGFRHGHYESALQCSSCLDDLHLRQDKPASFYGNFKRYTVRLPRWEVNVCAVSLGAGFAPLLCSIFAACLMGIRGPFESGMM